MESKMQSVIEGGAFLFPLVSGSEIDAGKIPDFRPVCIWVAFGGFWKGVKELWRSSGESLTYIAET